MKIENNAIITIPKYIITLLIGMMIGTNMTTYTLGGKLETIIENNNKLFTENMESKEK